VNEKQREFVTAILKIVFTVMLGGMAGGRLFNLDFSSWHYGIASVFLIGTFLLGFFLQRDGR